jgi:hypothetical protein
MSAQRYISINTLLFAGASIAIGQLALRRRKIVVKTKRLCWAISVVVLEFIT